jgi:hypothetical protein
LVGFRNDLLTVWDEENDSQLLKISDDAVYSIKRVLTSNSYIIKTFKDGVKVLAINDLKGQNYSLKLLLEVDKVDFFTQTDSF